MLGREILEISQKVMYVIKLPDSEGKKDIRDKSPHHMKELRVLRSY